MIFGGYYQIMNQKQHLEQNYFRYKKDTNIIMQHRPTFTKNEANATFEYMTNDNFITEHRKTSELESMLANFIGSKHCIMTTSGTNAIILALLACKFPPQSEIIVPNYTMIATVNSISLLGLKPILVDVDLNTFTLNIDDIQHNITKETKCIIHVSLNNRYTNLEKMVEYCKNNNIVLLEDSAQSLGLRTMHKQKMLGTFGAIGCFSLSTPKIISTGQGGFCVTDDDELAKQMKMIKNFGRRESGRDDFETFGINMKFTDIQAVIGIEQMKTIEWRMKRMRDIYDRYYSLLSSLINSNEHDIYMMKPMNEDWLPWFVDIYTTQRSELISFLKKHKIQTRETYGMINQTKMYFSNDILPNSQYVSDHGLFLPSYLTLNDDDIEFICKVIHIFYYNKYYQ
tara:strand:- start:108 stop:1301 length:1194 start_codon:yes stop_codon:yes gene_type:complete